MLELMCENNIIYTPDDLDGASYLILSKALEYCHRNFPNEPIILRICGNGGSIYHGMALYDQISDYGNVIGVATGRVYSAHVRIWLACQTRYITPNGVIGLHRVMNGYSLNTAQDAALAASEMQRLTDLLIHELDRMTEDSYHEWRRRIESGTEELYRLTARECVNMGIAHHMGWR